MEDKEEPDGVSLLDLGTDAAQPLNREDDDEPRDPDEFTEKFEKSVLKDQIRAVVRQYGEDGIAASVVADMVGVTTETARKHLNDLCQLRELYKQKQNKQSYAYYPNGKPLHGLGKRRVEAQGGDLVFEFQLAQGKNDDLFFHIKEKRFSLLEGERTEGALMFPAEKMDEFYQHMNDLLNEVPNE